MFRSRLPSARHSWRSLFRHSVQVGAVVASGKQLLGHKIFDFRSSRLVARDTQETAAMLQNIDHGRSEGIFGLARHRADDELMEARQPCL
jgi:hypothetical protein